MCGNHRTIGGGSWDESKGKLDSSDQMTTFTSCGIKKENFNTKTLQV